MDGERGVGVDGEAGAWCQAELHAGGGQETRSRYRDRRAAGRPCRPKPTLVTVGVPSKVNLSAADVADVPFGLVTVRST